MVKLSASRLYYVLVALAVVKAQNNDLTPVSQKSTLPEPYKLSLWTPDKHVTVYVNGRTRSGKIGAPMPGENVCYDPEGVSEETFDQCIGDVAISEVNSDKAVVFEIHRDHWTADTYQQCKLHLVKGPMLLHGAFTIKETEGFLYQPAQGDEDRVNVNCDEPKKD